MVVVFALLGWAVGCALSWASDWLPRYAQNPPEIPPGRPHLSALWQMLRGRRPHGWMLHLALEVGTGLFFALAFAWFGWVPALWLTLAAASFFLLVALIDAKYRLVLNIITYPALVIFLLTNIFLLRQSPLHAILGGALAFSIFFLTAWLKPGQLGFGDVKLATVIGVAFGFPGVLWALLVGAGAGGVAVLVLLVSRRGGLATTIPYAPFLCFGAVVVLVARPLLGLP